MSTNSTGSPYTPGAQDPQASPYGADPRPGGAQPPAAPGPKKSRGLAIATIVGAALSVVLLVVTIVLVEVVLTRPRHRALGLAKTP